MYQYKAGEIREAGGRYEFDIICITAKTRTGHLELVRTLAGSDQKPIDSCELAEKRQSTLVNSLNLVSVRFSVRAESDIASEEGKIE